MSKRKREEKETEDEPSTIRLINFEDYRQLKEFPRYPENKAICISKEDIDHDTSFVVFISHNWWRGHAGADGWDGRPHPDNADHEKHKLCVTGIDKMKKYFAPGMKSCYVWLDFGCINQDENPADELRQLNDIVQFADCIFTPIAGLATLSPTYKSMYSDYIVDAWNAKQKGYVNRGWCRVEMFYAANIPLSHNTPTRIEKFNVGLKFHLQNGVRPHALYGFRERDLNETPRLLPPLQNSTFEAMHPEKGEVTQPADKEKIKQLVAELRPYMTFAIHGYQGELRNGMKHGIGKLTCPNGDIYEGSFVNDMQEGDGVFTYANGYHYRGHFKNGKWEGKGKFTFADGGYYEGDFLKGKFHGHGCFVFSHGDSYTGEVFENMRHGKGTYVYANRNRYEGRFEENKMTQGLLFLQSDTYDSAHCNNAETVACATQRKHDVSVVASEYDASKDVSCYYAIFDPDVDNAVTLTVANIDSKNDTCSSKSSRYSYNNISMDEDNIDTCAAATNSSLCLKNTVARAVKRGLLVDGVFSPSP